MKKYQNLTSLLNKKITLQKRIENQDGAGGIEINWLDSFVFFGQISDLVKSKFQFGNKSINSDTYSIITRWNLIICKNDRIKFDNRIMNIKSISNLLQGNQVMEIICEEIF